MNSPKEHQDNEIATIDLAENVKFAAQSSSSCHAPPEPKPQDLEPRRTDSQCLAPPHRNRLDALFVVGFLCIVFLPLAAWIFPSHRPRPPFDRSGNTLPPPATSTINGSPVERLALGYKRIRYFLDGFNQSFVWRDTLVAWHGLTKINWFRTSSSTDVVLGKQGWYFYAGERSLDDHRRLRRYSSTDLAQWRSFFEKRRDWLAKRKCKFLVVVAPNKESVYSEYMPENLAPATGKTHFDQLLLYMKKHSSVQILDLRPALRAAKIKGRAKAEHLYYLTDSHWNGRGAVVAYTETARKLKHWYRQIRVVPESQFSVTSRPSSAGDLAELMGIRFCTSENVVQVKPRMSSMQVIRGKFASSPNLPAAEYKQRIATFRAGGEIPRGMLFGDSFSFHTDYLSLLSVHFKQGKHCKFGQNRDLDYQLIEKFRPNVVVYEIVERVLSISVRDMERKKQA